MDEADFIDRIILDRGDAFDNLTSEQYKALYSFNEIDFIGRVLSINQRDPQIISARDYAFTKRYIDDLLLWGVQPPSQDDYGGLQYAQHSVDVNSVTFLGSTITKLPNGSIIMSIYDKLFLIYFLVFLWSPFPIALPCVISYTLGILPVIWCPFHHRKSLEKLFAFEAHVGACVGAGCFLRLMEPQFTRRASPFRTASTSLSSFSSPLDVTIMYN
jgi:hypothetical protein